MIRVFIDGREGTTGLRIEERLSRREDIELLAIEPHLRKDASERRRLLNASDVAFLCLPDAAAREAAALVDNPDTILIDASTAHRTQPDWAYALPELSPTHRAKLTHSRRIAVPGCHASGFGALVYPLVAAGLINGDYPIVCHSVTGYSGGGKAMIAEYEAPDRSTALQSPRQYGLSQAHKHLPEMTHVCALESEPVFTPIVADFYAGMAVTVPLHTRLLRQGATPEGLRALYAAHYASQRLIRVLPDGSEAFLPANALAGRDDMHLAVFGNSQRMLLTAVFDNLGKGASGAAIQAMNIALGLPEDLGLALG